MEERLDRLGGPPPTRVSRRGARVAPTAQARPDRAELPSDPASLPDLPAAYDRALEDGLGVMGLSLSREARTAIAAHVRLLLAWNAAINLTAITDPAAIAIRHVLDSLTALPLVADAGSILDLGSGGGFPGLPLAAALPTARVTLVESVAKKAAFLEAAVAGAGLAWRATVLAARAEGVARPSASGMPRRRPDVVVARGVSDMAQLVELAMPLLAPGGRLIAWKRGDVTAELAAGARAAARLGGGSPVVHPALPGAARGTLAGLDGHILVEVRKIRPTPPGYPRDPAARRRRPW